MRAVLATKPQYLETDIHQPRHPARLGTGRVFRSDLLEQTSTDVQHPLTHLHHTGNRRQCRNSRTDCGNAEHQWLGFVSQCGKGLGDEGDDLGRVVGQRPDSVPHTSHRLIDRLVGLVPDLHRRFSTRAQVAVEPTLGLWRNVPILRVQRLVRGKSHQGSANLLWHIELCLGLLRISFLTHLRAGETR
ncbi:hypothetical protein D3C78_1153780 [compost metagenome]